MPSTEYLIHTKILRKKTVRHNARQLKKLQKFKLNFSTLIINIQVLGIFKLSTYGKNVWTYNRIRESLEFTAIIVCMLFVTLNFMDPSSFLICGKKKNAYNFRNKIKNILSLPMPSHFEQVAEHFFSWLKFVWNNFKDKCDLRRWVEIERQRCLFPQ